MLSAIDTITLDKERTLRCDINFWCLIDDKIGLQKFGEILESGQFGIFYLRTTLWALLAAEDEFRERPTLLSVGRVGLLLDFERMAETTEKMLALIAKGSPKPKGGENESAGPLASTGTQSGPSESLTLVSIPAKSDGSPSDNTQP